MARPRRSSARVSQLGPRSVLVRPDLGVLPRSASMSEIVNSHAERLLDLLRRDPAFGLPRPRFCTGTSLVRTSVCTTSRARPLLVRHLILTDEAHHRVGLGLRPGLRQQEHAEVVAPVALPPLSGMDAPL